MALTDLCGTGSGSGAFSQAGGVFMSFVLVYHCSAQCPSFVNNFVSRVFARKSRFIGTTIYIYFPLPVTSYDNEMQSWNDILDSILVETSFLDFPHRIANGQLKFIYAC